MEKKNYQRTTSDFSENALRVMKKRYLLKKEDGSQETPAEMFGRVARALAGAEKNYGRDEKFVKKIENDFFEIMANKEFTPAGRTLTNAGAPTPLVANCIVLPIEDSMEGIFQTLKDAALLQQAGSGLGFSFSSLRPAYSETKKSRGRASGPVSFLKVYNAAFGIIKQQGRHGANMAVMRVDHPDILDFIRAKMVEGEIRNFNISVGITDEFMEAVINRPDEKWLANFDGQRMKPHRVIYDENGRVSGCEEVDITAKELFDEIVGYAWLNGEPGVIFLDTINRANPLPKLGEIEATNPCGEQPLHPYDVCNLGSVNLAALVKDGEIDWERLRFVVKTAVRLLDNVIDQSDFPVVKVSEMMKKNRRVGLGVMGFADMLYQLKIKYNSEKGFQTAEKVMAAVEEEAHKASAALAKEKGVFPNYRLSVYAKKNVKMRNAAVTTVAPTGSISMIFDASSGIEPNFALSYVKRDKDGHQYRYLNQYFEKELKARGLYTKEIIDEVVKTGSVRHLTDLLPEDLREVFVVAMDMSAEDHIRMQAAFQKHVDTSISKTINFPNSAAKDDVASGFILAWKLGVKGCTVYRDGSRRVQVLNLGSGDRAEKAAIVALAAGGGDNEKKLEPRVRPEVMNGKTYQVKTGYGNLYITVNDDENGEPFEIFATIGKTGGFFQEQSEGICRMISLALRSGVKAEVIIKNLKGIRGPMPVMTNRGTILSLPDAIAQILDLHLNGKEDVLPKTADVLVSAPADVKAAAGVLPRGGKRSIASFGLMPGCPDCGAELQLAEGCMSCRSCGFSRCT